MVRFIYADGDFVEAPEGAAAAAAHDAAREPERRVIERRAVRAVAFRGDRLLMIHARGPGDFKFPGGGVEPGESAIEALGRELREETGHELALAGAPALRVEERRPAKEAGAVFHMISDYYLCEVADGPAGRQSLDAYEARLGFAPAWVSPEEALAANEALVAEGDASPWIRREIFALRRLCLRGRAPAGAGGTADASGPAGDLIAAGVPVPTDRTAIGPSAGSAAGPAAGAAADQAAAMSADEPCAGSAAGPAAGAAAMPAAVPAKDLS